MTDWIVDTVKAVAKAAAITTVIVGLIVLILLYVVDVSLDSNLIKILCGCWIIATVGASFYFKDSSISAGSTTVNISQTGTVYQMKMNCTPNDTATEINCTTDVDFLNKQVSFVNALKHVPLLGELIHAASDISSFGTQMAESIMGLPLGSTEMRIKNSVSNGIDTIVDTIAQPFNLYNKNTVKSIT